MVRAFLAGDSITNIAKEHGVSSSLVRTTTCQYCRKSVYGAPQEVLNQLHGRRPERYRAAANYFLSIITVETMLQRHVVIERRKQEVAEISRTPKRSPFRNPAKIVWNEVAKVGYPPTSLHVNNEVQNNPLRKFLVRSEYDLDCAYAIESGGFKTSDRFQGEVIAWAVIGGF
jgi:hypothetical protein